MKTCQVLSLSGGGSFGSLEIGILSNIVPSFSPDIITGVSAGALNAGFLSHYQDNLSQGVDELHQLYASLDNDQIYKRDLLNFENSWSYYSTEPLRHTIRRQLETRNTTTTNKKITLIGTTNLYTGLLDKYHFESLSKPDQEELLLATSAIPLLFPPIHFQNQLYVDGGVLANEILFGFDEFMNTCDFYNITFITSHANFETITKIDSFSEYMKRLVNMVVTNFDNQLSEVISEESSKGKCSTIKGDIHFYYPDPTKIASYSVLDFSHGDELYQIGKQNTIYEYYPYCPK